MLVILASILAACAGVLADIPLSLDVEESFKHFIRKHDRNYVSEQEKQERFQVFKRNVEDAIRKNEEHNDEIFGITQFMDLTADEFTSTYGCWKSNRFSFFCNDLTDKDIPSVAAPESFDWRDHNAVTRIKDQKRCGSCWAFSAVGNVEGLNAIKNKELIELSEQELVDCDITSGGCRGGDMRSALSFFMLAGGAMSEAAYPYMAKDGENCLFDMHKVKVAVKNCSSYNLLSQEKLKQLLYQNGPLTIGLDATSLQSYKKSILPASKCHFVKINHGLVLVGYGIENGTKYWLIKNSWGEKFGEKGYVRIERGENTNACGIMNDSGTNTAIL